MYSPSQIQCVRVLEIISLFDKYISETLQCKQVKPQINENGFCCPGNKTYLGEVCFECTGNMYGTIHNLLSEPQLVAAMKLVYRGG